MKSLFDTEEFKSLQQMWATRQQVLRSRKSYYDGTIYKQVNTRFGWLAPRISGGIKPLYMPLARAVDVDAGLIPGKWTLEDGVPDAIRKARDEVLSWSRWKTDGVLYVHYGAEYGLSGLRVADLREDRKVVIQPVNPTNFMLVRQNQYSDEPTMAIWIEARTDSAGNKYEYAEVVTPDEIRTYLSGDLYSYAGRPDHYPNELGYVPYVEVVHLETGDALGECTYQKAIEMLDEVNSLSTDLAKIIKKHAEPQWAVFGADPGDLKHGGDVVWFIPSGGDAKILVPDIDIDGVLSFIQEIKSAVKESLPELAFDELKHKENIAAATLELQLMELVLKIGRTRPNYDEGLESALRMAGRAAASMGMSDIAVLDSPLLQINSDRQVMPIDEETSIRIEMQRIALDQERALGRANKLEEKS